MPEDALVGALHLMFPGKPQEHIEELMVSLVPRISYPGDEAKLVVCAKTIAPEDDENINL